MSSSPDSVGNEESYLFIQGSWVRTPTQLVTTRAIYLYRNPMFEPQKVGNDESYLFIQGSWVWAATQSVTTRASFIYPEFLSSRPDSVGNDDSYLFMQGSCVRAPIQADTMRAIHVSSDHVYVNCRRDITEINFEIVLANSGASLQI